MRMTSTSIYCSAKLPQSEPQHMPLTLPNTPSSLQRGPPSIVAASDPPPTLPPTDRSRRPVQTSSRLHFSPEPVRHKKVQPGTSRHETRRDSFYINNKLRFSHTRNVVLPPFCPRAGDTPHQVTPPPHTYTHTVTAKTVNPPPLSSLFTSFSCCCSVFNAWSVIFLHLLLCLLLFSVKIIWPFAPPPPGQNGVNNRSSVWFSITNRRLGRGRQR